MQARATRQMFHGVVVPPPRAGGERSRLFLPTTNQTTCAPFYTNYPTSAFCVVRWLTNHERDRPPPWVLRGIAHHHAYYAASPTTVDTRPHTLKSEVPLSRIIFALYLSPLAMWAKGTMYQVDNPWCVRFW